MDANCKTFEDFWNRDIIQVWTYPDMANPATKIPHPFTQAQKVSLMILFAIKKKRKIMILKQIIPWHGILMIENVRCSKNIKHGLKPLTIL